MSAVSVYFSVLETCVRAYRRFVFISSTTGETKIRFFAPFSCFYFSVRLLTSGGCWRRTAQHVAGLGRSFADGDYCYYCCSSSSSSSPLLLITVGHRGGGGGGVVNSRPVHERLANRNAVCPIFSSRYNIHTLTYTHTHSGTTALLALFSKHGGWRVTQRRGYLGPNARAHAHIPGIRESYGLAHDRRAEDGTAAGRNTGRPGG